MVSVAEYPHSGQVIVERRVGVSLGTVIPSIMAKNAPARL